ncbi:cytochrome c [Silvibacterium bohemicum]|uniref:Cytochrome c n=1 Tax=Silvibacterium bohemicum TaxID=1577686 RepID=A0A841K0J3_9BACT|nr:c-type cytochrome [Silvibacterium bohemicum]MBB6146495.1 cytochrome c [Silvibacterium bohemicum]
MLAAVFSLAIVICVVTSTPPAIQAAGNGTADADRGEQLFDRRCTGCHALDADKVGPRLRNVYGRKAGTVPTFKYSDAMKAAKFTWDDASLEKWLTDTDSVIHGNDMDFRVPKPDERADIIRFLKVSSGN